MKTDGNLSERLVEYPAKPAYTLQEYIPAVLQSITAELEQNKDGQTEHGDDELQGLEKGDAGLGVGKHQIRVVALEA